MKYFVLFFCYLFFSPAVWTDSIAFFYALDEDLSELISHSNDAPRNEKVGSRKIYSLRIHGHNVHAVKMASGCVETAISAQALLARHTCDYAISVGPSGSLQENVATGSWFFVNRVIPWQKGSESSSGFQPGAAISLSDHFRWQPNTPNFDSVTLASGEAFIASASFNKRLNLQTDAALVDMNSYGLAAACIDHGTPLYIYRVVSDKADENAGQTFIGFSKDYQGDGGKLAVEIIKQIPPNPDSPHSYEQIRNLINQ